VSAKPAKQACAERSELAALQHGAVFSHGFAFLRGWHSLRDLVSLWFERNQD